MLLKNFDRESGQLFDPRDFGGLILTRGRLECALHTPISISSDDAAKRFLDIADAYDSGDVRVYDLTQPIGYWKPKKTAAKKPAAKKPAAAPEPKPKA